MWPKVVLHVFADGRLVLGTGGWGKPNWVVINREEFEPDFDMKMWDWGERWLEQDWNAGKNDMTDEEAAKCYLLHLWDDRENEHEQ
jgi:hypothetical protein